MECNLLQGALVICTDKPVHLWLLRYYTKNSQWITSQVSTSGGREHNCTVEKWRQVGSLGSIQRHLVSHWQVGKYTCESRHSLLRASFERKASAPPFINTGINQKENRNWRGVKKKKNHQKAISKMGKGKVLFRSSTIALKIITVMLTRNKWK